MVRRLRSPALPLLALLLAAGGCTESSSGPDSDHATMSRIAGSYAASEDYGAIRITATGEGQSTDVVAAGGSLQMELGADGRTTGRLFVPDAGEEGGDVDADLTGTWSVHGDTVWFQQAADTFVRDMPFLVVGSRLEGDETYSGVRVQVTLEKR